MVHSEGIWNNLELQTHFENKDDKWCILTASETILGTTEKNENRTFW